MLNGPPVEAIDAMIADLAATGAQVMITEMDIDPLPRPAEAIGADLATRIERTTELDPYRDGLTESVQQRFAQRYADIFHVLLKHRAVSRVTFWGVTDADTWLNDWPVPGRTNHTLLRDRQGRPKPAFDAVIEALRRTRTAGA